MLFPPATPQVGFSYRDGIFKYRGGGQSRIRRVFTRDGGWNVEVQEQALFGISILGDKTEKQSKKGMMERWFKR